MVIALVMVLNFSMFGAMQASAHNAMLDVDYDECEVVQYQDGIDELWYVLGTELECSHLSHEEQTIKYYFEQSFLDGEYTWTTDVSEAVAQEIKNAYAVYEEHSYNNCVYKNELYHTATCDCGYQRILMHWTKESELTGGRYERCAGCGAWIDLRDNILPGNPLSVVTKVSANGSYILPSGIAVVVDADVEAYMNETLIFYNPDDVPVTQ